MKMKVFFLWILAFILAGCSKDCHNQDALILKQKVTKWKVGIEDLYDEPRLTFEFSTTVGEIKEIIFTGTLVFKNENSSEIYRLNFSEIDFVFYPSGKVLHGVYKYSMKEYLDAPWVITEKSIQGKIRIKNKWYYL